MLPFGVTIPGTLPQRSEIPEWLMNYPVFGGTLVRAVISFALVLSLIENKCKSYWDKISPWGDWGVIFTNCLILILISVDHSFKLSNTKCPLLTRIWVCRFERPFAHLKVMSAMTTWKEMLSIQDAWMLWIIEKKHNRLIYCICNLLSSVLKRHLILFY